MLSVAYLTVLFHKTFLATLEGRYYHDLLTEKDENSRSLSTATELRTGRPQSNAQAGGAKNLCSWPLGRKKIKHWTYVYQSLGWRLTEWFFPFVGVSFVADLLNRNSWSFCFTSVLATAPETHTYRNRCWCGALSFCISEVFSKN